MIVIADRFRAKECVGYVEVRGLTNRHLLKDAGQNRCGLVENGCPCLEQIRLRYSGDIRKVQGGRPEACWLSGRATNARKKTGDEVLPCLSHRYHLRVDARHTCC